MLFPLAPIPGLESAATIRWICTISCGEKFAKFGGDGTSIERKSNCEMVGTIDSEAPASMVYQNKLTAFLIMIASGIVYNLAAHLNIAGKHVLMQPIPAQATVIVYIPAFQNHA